MVVRICPLMLRQQSKVCSIQKWFYAFETLTVLSKPLLSKLCWLKLNWGLSSIDHSKKIRLRKQSESDLSNFWFVKQRAPYLKWLFVKVRFGSRKTKHSAGIFHLVQPSLTQRVPFSNSPKSLNLPAGAGNRIGRAFVLSWHAELACWQIKVNQFKQNGCHCNLY